MATVNTFHWLDYLIFILMLVISASIGIFYAWRDKRVQSTDNFLLGGRQMSLLPVSLSLMASFLSAVLVLGVPTEVFYNGTMYWMICFSNLLTFPVVVHAILPVFHNLEIVSAYEYLERRFNRAVRVLGSLLFIVQMILYMALVLYAPAIAINQVMGISIFVSILAIGVVCTFYTAIGGLKAVMWTDAFQMTIVFGGILAIVIKGSMEMGGFSQVWEIASNGSRLHIDNFNASPLERHTFWTLVIGGFVTSLTLYASNQAMIQRYLSMASVRKAQTALYMQLPASIIFTSLLVYLGLVLYARYHDDDPLQSCAINRRDQLIPWLVMDVLGNYHGFPGLVIACLFSASLSTVSSGVNALSLVFLTDLVKPTYKAVTGEHMAEKSATVASKILAIIFGGITIGLGFLAQYFGSLILQVALSIFGMVGGPLLGLFVCAMFIPIINSWGAIVGVIASFGVTTWVAIGSIIYRSNRAPPNPCDSTIPTIATNSTSSPYTSPAASVSHTGAAVTHLPDVNDESILAGVYQLSYLWYSTLAVVVVVVVGLIVSCATGGTKTRPVDKRLLSPVYTWISSRSSVFPSASSERTLVDSYYREFEMNRLETLKAANGVYNVQSDISTANGECSDTEPEFIDPADT